jgi:thiamine kinase-like enzyme
MKQGFSGSKVQRSGNLVEKISNDDSFTSSKERQKDLVALSHRLVILPRIDRITGQSIFMEYIEGHEELTEHNARQAGNALRLLHEQSDYQHPCMTGLDWLIQTANENLTQSNYSYQDFSGFKAEYPIDALIHSEPAQFIEKEDGTIVFIDIEGIGMGTHYQDLGSIYYMTVKDEKPGIFVAFMEGYQSTPIHIELRRLKKLAGLYSIAYAAFAEFEKRMEFGLRLLDETRK